MPFLSRAFGAALLASAALFFAQDAAAKKPTARQCIRSATDGQKLRDQGKLIDARAEFLACSNKACPSDIRTDCGEWLTRVEQATPRVVFGARDAEGRDRVRVRVRVNDTVVATELLGREQSLDPGPYRFDFEAEDGARASVAAVLRAGDATRTIVATLRHDDDPAVAPEQAKPPATSTETPPSEAAVKTPPQAPAPPRETNTARSVALIASGSGAALAAGAFVVFLLRAQSGHRDLESSCSPNCTASETRSLRTDIVLANVTGIAALSLVALFAGTAIFTSSTLPPKQTATSSLLRDFGTIRW